MVLICKSYLCFAVGMGLSLSRLDPVTNSRSGAVQAVPERFFVRIGDIVSPVVSALREGVRREQTPLQKAWVTLLTNYDWQWFATFTFKDAKHPESADKSFRYWAKQLSLAAGYKPRAPLTHKRRVVWARGLEWQKRDVLHFHALIGNLPYEYSARAVREAWSMAWLEMGKTGFARVDLVNDITNASGYVAKYCAKGGEIDISPNLAVALPDLSGSIDLASGGQC
jgi:hypothetical protein